MDEIIEKVGNFGPFQALLFASTCSTIDLSVMGMMFMMYGNYNPGWTCIDDINRTDNLTLSNTSNVTVDEVDFMSGDECKAWRECTNVVFDKESSTVVTEWNLMCDNSWIPSLIIMIQMLGVVAGAWICGLVGDRFGRRVGLYGSVAFHAATHVLCAFSTSWQMFASMIFLVGIAVGGILSAGAIYHMEFVGSWWRPVLTSVPVWSIGCVEFAVLVLICKNWKTVHFTVAVLSSLALLPVFWMPESIRWLAVHGKYDKVVCVVERMAWWNRKPAVNKEQIYKTSMDIYQAQISTKKPSYIDLFKTAKIRRYSVKFGLTWILMAVVYYTISFGVKSFSGNFYINLILFTLAEMPGNFVVSLSNKIGRRYTALLLFCVSALCSFVVVASNFVPGPIADKISLASAIISKTAVTGAWSVVTVMSTELYPTVVRMLHIGYLSAISRIGTILSPYLIPADNSKLFISYTVSGLILLICAALVCSVSETKGRRMADTIHDVKRRKTDVDDNDNLNRHEEIVQLDP